MDWIIIDKTTFVLPVGELIRVKIYRTGNKYNIFINGSPYGSDKLTSKDAKKNAIECVEKILLDMVYDIEQNREELIAEIN